MKSEIDSKKKSIEAKGRIREFVFGIQDGLISTVGLVSAIQGATQNSRTVILAGLAAMFTGGLSMATGSYLSTKSQKEIFDRELREQKKFVEGQPYLAQEGLLDALAQEGLSRDRAYRVVKIFSDEKAVFVRTFQEKVLGIGSADIDKPIQAALVMYVSFMIGAFIPIVPYFALAGRSALLLSAASAAAALFAVGFFKGILAGKKPLVSGLEFLAVALASAGLGWLFGLPFGGLAG